MIEAVQNTEVPVPRILCVVLRVSVALGAAPVRLRKCCGEWLLSVAPRKATWQITLTVLINLSIIAVVITKVFDNYSRQTGLAEGKQIETLILACKGMIYILLHLFVSKNAVGKMRTLLTLLQHTHKIKFYVKCNVSNSSERSLLYVFVILFITWIITTTAYNVYSSLSGLVAKQRFELTNIEKYFYGAVLYQSIVIDMKQLQWSRCVAEISSTLIVINDQLELLLQNPIFVHNSLINSTRNQKKSKSIKLITNSLPQDNSSKSDEVPLAIRHLAQCYEKMYETLRQMDRDHASFLVVSVVATCLHLLMTPYYLIQFFTHKAIDENTFARWPYALPIMLFNWLLYRFSSLVVMIEPCHLAQDQMKRTRCLLSRMACHVKRRAGAVAQEVDLFIRQVEYDEPVFSPLGVFTISRPLIVPIIAGVTTYLVIFIQIQNVNDLI